MMGCSGKATVERTQTVAGTGELAVEVLAVVAQHGLALGANPLHRVAVAAHQAVGPPGWKIPVCVRHICDVVILLSNQSTSDGDMPLPFSFSVQAERHSGRDKTHRQNVVQTVIRPV